MQASDANIQTNPVYGYRSNCRHNKKIFVKFCKIVMEEFKYQIFICIRI
jgi:hypothetical protein